MAGIKLTQVPYKGGVPAALSVVSGETNTAIVTTSTVVPFEKSGSLKVLAVTSSNRLPSEPNWPTIAELGYPGYEFNLWSGLFVRKETPAPIMKKLEDDFRAVVADPEVVARFDGLGTEPGRLTLPQFKEMIAKEIANNKRVIESPKMQGQ